MASGVRLADDGKGAISGAISPAGTGALSLRMPFRDGGVAAPFGRATSGVLGVIRESSVSVRR